MSAVNGRSSTHHACNGSGVIYLISHGAMVILLALWAALPTAAVASADLNRAKQVVEELGTEAVAAIGDESLSDQQLASRFSDILERGFDMDRIARFVLGRHWRTASDAEKARYLELFREFVVRTYVGRFDEYSGEVLKVSNAREEGRYVLVTSTIRRPAGSPVAVEWRMEEKDNVFKVIDVVVEGVSMGITQRAEFDAIIQRQGGSLTALNDALEDRLSRDAD